MIVTLLVLSFNCWSGTSKKSALLVEVLGLELLDAAEHELFAVLDEVLGLRLVSVVIRSDQVRNAHIVLREGRFF